MRHTFRILLLFFALSVVTVVIGVVWRAHSLSVKKIALHITSPEISNLNGAELKDENLEGKRLNLSSQNDIILNQFKLSKTDIKSADHEIILSLQRLDDNPSDYLDFEVEISLNGWLLSEISSNKISLDHWSTISVDLPSDKLNVGLNNVTLKLNRDLNGNYLRLLINKNTTITDRNCHWKPDIKTWDCLPDDYHYSMDLYSMPHDLSTIIDPDYHYLLDEDKYALLACDVDRAIWGRTNAYFVDLTNRDEIEALRGLSFEGEGYELAFNIMNYIYNEHVNIGGSNESGDNNAHSYVFSPGKMACSASAYTFVALAYLNGIDGRVVFLRNPITKTGHVLAEAYIEGEWVMFDPFSGFDFTHEDKHYSVRDITEDTEAYEAFLNKNHRNFSLQKSGDPLTPYFEDINEATVFCGGKQIPYYDQHDVAEYNGPIIPSVY